MLNVIKESSIALMVGPPGVGKSHQVLELIQHEYLNVFEKIVLFCPTLTINRSYIACDFLWKDENAYVVNPSRDPFLRRDEDSKYPLLTWVDQLSNAAIGLKTLFILDDCIADAVIENE